MKTQLVASVFIISLPFLMVSCVSSILKEKAPTFSKEIQFKEPKSSFVKINLSVYPAWKNSKTGNVISIVSDCAENYSGSLSGLHQLIIGSIEEPKILQQQALTFKQKPALMYITEGQLDGQPIAVRSMSFQRKDCGYVSSLSGRPPVLATDLKSFEEFNESFSFE
jgi:hypothetical protein